MVQSSPICRGYGDVRLLQPDKVVGAGKRAKGMGTLRTGGFDRKHAGFV